MKDDTTRILKAATPRFCFEGRNFDSRPTDTSNNISGGVCRLGELRISVVLDNAKGENGLADCFHWTLPNPHATMVGGRVAHLGLGIEWKRKFRRSGSFAFEFLHQTRVTIRTCEVEGGEGGMTLAKCRRSAQSVAGRCKFVRGGGISK